MVRQAFMGAVWVAAVALGGCPSAGEAPPEPSDLVNDGTDAIPETDVARAQQAAMLDEEYPLHGLVTGLQLAVRREPRPDADPVGWLRIGSRVRLKRGATMTSTCGSGWYRIYPQGWACAGLGIELGDEPPQPEAEFVVAPPARDAALPYQYWFVKELMVPEYHRPPSRNEQRAAIAYRNRYLELLADNERRAARFVAGELRNEPERPVVVHRYLDRGFFVASTGIEVRAFRRFVRTVRGRYIKQANLIERTGADFVGVELGADRQLPVAWVVRTARPRIKQEREDGTIRWVNDEEAEPIERHTVLESWTGRENIGGQYMHILEGDRYLRDWFVAVARPMARPRGVRAGEPWVNVNLEQQTLVLYEGDTPVFATLVSTGQEGFETREGVFTVRRKYIADTMANVGAGQDERYSIEDVPWTQYFDRSIALHAAFWHERFGLTRSHGCVNMSPRDAHRVFDALWPRIPDGWLGVTTHRTRFQASHVVVTP